MKQFPDNLAATEVWRALECRTGAFSIHHVLLGLRSGENIPRRRKPQKGTATGRLKSDDRIDPT